jgi:hypothetical protein
MGKKFGLETAYNKLKAVTKAYPITGGKFPKGSFMERSLNLRAGSGDVKTKYGSALTTSVNKGSALTTSVNKGSKLLNIGKKVFGRTPIGRAVNLAVNVGSGIGIGYSYAKNKFNKKKADFQKGDYSDIKTDKKSAGGEMNQMNIKGYMGGGASRGYGAARTSGMGLQDESLMPGKMVRAKNGKMLSAKQKKIARMAPPPDKITGEDFKAMKAKNGKMVKAFLGTFIKDMFGQKQRTASVSPTTDALKLGVPLEEYAKTGDQNMEVRKIIMNKFRNKMGAKHGKHMKK